ncbi:MAG: hypothetical protein A2Z72_04680 [Omnitrophica bacterium RBG_13_46_9]|nr:MAG: hypothetical protein A2Z72_04680 [Omnitrophica bacterium RBG_13_46_9]
MDGGILIKYRKWINSAIFIALCLILWLFVKTFLHDKIIGISNQPGFQGEILFQKNFIYNFEKGNTFRHFNTDYLNYPFGENLGFGLANSLHLFMYIPLKFFFGTIESYNVLVMIIFILNFLSAYLLAKYLFSSKMVAFCSALVFALNPYVLLKINLGFVQKFILFWIPLYSLALFRLRDTKRWRYVLGAIIILCLMQFTYPPYAYFAVIFTILLLPYLFIKPAETWFALSRFSLIISSLFVLTSIVYYLMGFGSVYFNMFKPKANINLDGCLNLFRPFHFFPYISSRYSIDLPLGIPFSAFAVGIIAFIKKKGLSKLIFLIFLFFVVIAAGAYLTYAGQPIQIFGHKIILPFYFMTKYLPFAGDALLPFRAFPFINICLAILTGYGLLHISSVIRKIRPFFIAAFFSVIYLSELVICFPQLFPPEVSDVTIPLFYQKIRNENFEAVLNLPISQKRSVINLYGYYAVLSGKKMLNPYHAKTLRIYLPKDSDSLQMKAEFIERLSGRNVGYVIVHGNFLRKHRNSGSSDRFSWLEEFCETAHYPEDNLRVYKIPMPNEIYKNKSVTNAAGDFPSMQKGIEAAENGGSY